MRQLRLRDLRPGMVLRTKGPIKNVIIIFKKDGVLLWRYPDKPYSEGHPTAFFDHWDHRGKWYVVNKLLAVCKDE